jgi:hypothetical protein
MMEFRTYSLATMRVFFNAENFGTYVTFNQQNKFLIFSLALLDNVSKFSQTEKFLKKMHSIKKCYSFLIIMMMQFSFMSK